MNTASRETSDPQTGQNSSSVLDVGGGKADGLAALNATITVEPSSVSFGILGSDFTSSSCALTLVNHAQESATLTVSVSRTNPDAATQLTVDQSSLVISGGQSAVVNVSLSGAAPASGIYEGAILIAGTTLSLHVPYLSCW